MLSLSPFTIVLGVLLLLMVAVAVGFLTYLWLKDRDLLMELLVGAWFCWLFAGWAPTIFMLIFATTKTTLYIGFGMLVAYILAWTPIAVSD